MRRHFLGRALVSTMVHVHFYTQKVQKNIQNVKQSFNSIFAALVAFKYPVHLCLPAVSGECSNIWQMLQVPVPAEWVDAIFPKVRALLDTVQERNARMQSGKRQADDLMSDKAAEGFLQTAPVQWHPLLAEIAFQNSEVSMDQDAGCWQPTLFSNHELVLQIWDGICSAQTACSCPNHHDPGVPELCTAGHDQS